MLYNTASNPRLACLYICGPVANVLGRAPLIPCFIGGNSHPTIPQSFKDDARLGSASADTRRDRGKGSRLYDVNTRMWRYHYDRGRPRMVSINEAKRIRRERVSESRIRGAETRKRHSEAAAAARAAETAAERGQALGMLSYMISSIACDIILLGPQHSTCGRLP
jgi:hypothetical protein